MADEEAENLLKSWNLEILLTDFKDNDIDSTALKHLSATLIKELIPKIGLRIKFIKKWEEHFKHSQDAPRNGGVENIQNKQHSVLSDTVSNTDDESNSSFDFASHTLTRQNCFVVSPKHQNESQKKNINLNVKELLKNTASGRCILKSSRNLSLPESTRRLLVDLIVTEALESFSGRRCPIQVDFENVADQIQTIFPKEHKNSYYIAPVKKRSSRLHSSITARGKLVDKYRNKLQRYRRLSGCDPLRESSTSESITSDTVADEIQSSLLWLEHNREPWDSVVQHWEITAPHRLENERSEIQTVHDYLEKWPVLRHSNGHTLIELDYKYLHKSENHGVFVHWEKFFSHIKNSRPINKESNAKSLLSLLEMPTLTVDCKVVVQIMLLPYLVAPRGRLRISKKPTDTADTEFHDNRKKQQWKFSIVECQKSFILHVKVAGDLLTMQQQRINEVAVLGLTVQPYIIVVGPTLDSIEAFYVSLDSTLYKVPTALKALDLCFKSFHAVNALYPPESEHLWYLIQFAVYKITTKWDKQISYIVDILASMPDFGN